MIRKLRALLEKHLSLLTVLLFAVQPALDVFSYFMARWGRSVLSTGLRFALLAVVALVGLLLSRRRKVYFVFYGAALLFWAAHALNCFRVGYASPVSDAGNYLRILNFPIFTLTMITVLERGENLRRSVIFGMVLAFGEILLFTALPWALGRPVYTYESLGVGVMGWFGVANAQSAIIVLVIPLTLYWAYRSKRYWLFLGAMVLSVGLLYVTGTKFTFYSIFIICGAFALVFFLRLRLKGLKYVLPLVAVAVVVFAFRHQSPMATRERMSDYHHGLYDELVENSLENSADEETVTLIRKGAQVAGVSDDRLERVRRALMGVYTDKSVYGTLFKNLYDRFGVYNVMAAYNYTVEPTILSDSRLRKGVFAELMWEEKDFLTQCLGYEYSDMLMGGAIYDLENDFPALFYFCGYVGFALYMLLFVFFVVWVLRALAKTVSAQPGPKKPRGRLLAFPVRCWQGVVAFLTPEMAAVGMTFLLAVIAAQISGNVLRRPNVTVYFGAAAALLYHLCRDRLRPPASSPEEAE